MEWHVPGLIAPSNRTPPPRFVTDVVLELGLASHDDVHAAVEAARASGGRPEAMLVRAVIAESFERIHRSNLVGMGVVPLQFPEGESAESLGLTGEEEFSITGLAEPLNAGDLPRTVAVKAGDVEFEARLRIDTPKEAEYFRHGGILQYVLRSLLQR